MPELHEVVASPNWDMKIYCSCGERSASKMEHYIHASESLRAKIRGTGTDPCVHSMLVDDCASCWHGAYLRAQKELNLRGRELLEIETIINVSSKVRYSIMSALAIVGGFKKRNEGITW